MRAVLILVPLALFGCSSEDQSPSSDSPLADQCVVGATTCSGDAVRVCTVRESDGRTEWGPRNPCSQEEPYCSLGQCKAFCVDECHEGESRCVASGGLQRCGQADSDMCLDWLPESPCPAGLNCQAGSCQANGCTDDCQPGQTKCDGAGVVSCGLFDDDPCLDWGFMSPCPEGEACSNGACLSDCVDECSESVCEGGIWRQCGSFDFDRCLEYSPGERACRDDDSPLGKLVFLGGLNYQGPYYNEDGWTFDGTNWARLSSLGPRSRKNHHTVTVGNRVMLFGGKWSTGSGVDPDLDETWLFDGVRWTGAAPGPMLEYGYRDGAMATFGNQAVLFAHARTWLFDGTRWTQVQVPGPPDRSGHAMAMLGDKVVLFGGSGNLGDTWIFDGTSWTELSIPGPPPRENHAMATLGDRVVLFGGDVEYGTQIGDTWIFDGSTWEELNIPGPRARSEFGMATLGSRVVLVGGYNDEDGYDTAPMKDAWAFDGVSWTELAVPDWPNRYAFSMALLR